MSFYKVGDQYFVLNGNHRVSEARYQGVEMIDAEVVELRPRKPTESRPTVWQFAARDHPEPRVEKTSRSTNPSERRR